MNRFTGDNFGQLVQASSIGRVDFHSPPPLKALAGLPPTTPLFRGREAELCELRTAWEAGSGPSIVASGLAGIGKTELVLHAAHQAVDDGLFPGGVLFVDLQGYDDQRRVTPEQALETFLLSLGVPATGVSAEVDQRSALYRSLLTEQDTMLIVLDNARSAEQIRPLLPGTSQHRVVITSRHGLTSVDGADQLEVGLLSEAEAADLVGDAELARLCGRLPLALRIMKALIVTDPHADWAAELGDARLELLDDGDSHAVHAAFALSYRALSSDQQRLFRLLALHPGDEIELDGAAALIGLPTARTRPLLRELRRAHLVEGGTRPGWFRFHDLVRLYAQSCVDEEPNRDAALDRVLAHYAKVGTAAGTHLNHFRTPDSSFATIAEALAWLDEHRSTIVAAIVIAAEHDKHPAVLALEGGLTYYLNHRHALVDGVTVYERGLQAARRMGDIEAEMKALSVLGYYHVEMGHLDEARQLFEEALTMSRGIGDRLREGDALFQLGKVYHDRQNVDAALTCFTESLSIDRELGDRRSEGMTLTAMAKACTTAGRLHDALAHAEKAAAIFVEVRDPANEGWALYRLGIIHLGLNHPDQAVDALERSLEMHRSTGSSFGEASTQYTLGAAYVWRKDRPTARAAAQEAVRLFELLGLRQQTEAARQLLSGLST